MSDIQTPAVMMPDSTPEQLRAKAARYQQESRESFERCDTDGALSQWASDLNAAKSRMEADLLEQDGVAEFLCLFKLDGSYQPARQFTDRWGNSKWMLLDENGVRTGEYLPYAPARRSTHEKRGYVEGRAVWPAMIVLRGASATSVRPVRIRKGADHDPPIEIIETARDYRGGE